MARTYEVYLREHLTRSHQDGDFWSVFNRGWLRVKTLQLLVVLFYIMFY